MRLYGSKWRVRCIREGCGWRGIRTDSIECECYDEWAAACRPGTPGPGCPRGVVWPCPRCGRIEGTPRFPEGSTVVADRPVRHRPAGVAGPQPEPVPDEVWAA